MTRGQQQQNQCTSTSNFTHHHRLKGGETQAVPVGRGPRGAPMVGGVRMLDGRPGGVLPLESGIPGSGLPGDAGMPMYLRARSSMPATQEGSQMIC